MDDPFIKTRSLMETRGKLICFEICKGNFVATKRLGFKPKFCYLITKVYSVDGADLGLQSFEWHGPSSTVSGLVDKYIEQSSSIEYDRKIPYPVRNMSSGKDSTRLGYEPLNQEEIAEFKCLLLSQDPERYALSFSP